MHNKNQALVYGPTLTSRLEPSLHSHLFPGGPFLPSHLFPGGPSQPSHLFPGGPPLPSHLFPGGPSLPSHVVPDPSFPYHDLRGPSDLPHSSRSPFQPPLFSEGFGPLWPAGYPYRLPWAGGNRPPLPRPVPVYPPSAFSYPQSAFAYPPSATSSPWFRPISSSADDGGRPYGSPTGDHGGDIPMKKESGDGAMTGGGQVYPEEASGSREDTTLSHPQITEISRIL